MSLHQVSKWTHAVLVACGLLVGCSTGREAPPATDSVHPLVSEIDSFLSEPYEAHFSEVQGDYVVALQLNGAVEELAGRNHNAVPMTRMIALSWGLTKHRSESDYDSIVREWQQVRPQVK